ncbi:MAG: hypothetical protein AzoDbin1_01868 [Azoarcus sp.]|nr:hypothetical protein [Azoarcus sp.]
MFFASIQKLLEGAEAVTVIMVPASDGRVGVTVAPKMKEKADPALARPLSLIGTVEELDAEFGQLMGQHATVRKSLAEQLAAAQAEMAAAAKANAKKPAAAPAKTVPPATPKAVSLDDLEPDETGGEENEDDTAPQAPAEAVAPVPTSTPAPAADGLDLANLL